MESNGTGKQHLENGLTILKSGNFSLFEEYIEQLIRQGDENPAAELCLLALQRNIHVDSIPALIHEHHLSPPHHSLDIKRWPWKLKVYSLGRFSLLLDNVPLNVGVKGRAKPVKLLKVLIAYGGRDVSELRLCEALWPDAEGDQAHSAFTTTLSRLRKIIGSELLSFQGGMLSLNARYCWVDCWEFERSLGELEELISKQDISLKGTILSRMNKVFELYHGKFLEKEPSMGWLLPQRERLQTRFLRIIKLMIQFYRESGGHCQHVIALYEKARELDPLSEEYCRGLMRCHAAQGNRPEALAIFDRCHSILTEAFGLQPSNKTTDLYQLIKFGDQDQLFSFCNLCTRACN